MEWKDNYTPQNLFTVRRAVFTLLSW